MRNLSTVLLVLILAVIAGCSTQQPTDAGTMGNSSGISVLDSRGKEIVFDSPPSRIVSLSPAHTEIFYMLGLENHLVGVDSYSDFPEQVSEKPQVGDAFTLNMEAVVGLEPDLIYTTFDGPVEALEELGLKVLYLFPAKDVKGVLQNIKLMGDITDREHEARDLIEGVESQIKIAKSRLSGLEAEFRVYYELDPGFYTVGDDSFIGDMLSMLGLQNIATGTHSPYPKISEEVIILNDPEIIILANGQEFVSTGTTVDEVIGRSGWQSITAIRKRSIYMVDGSLISRPGPRIGVGVEKVVDIILDNHSKQP